jgi:hypothetical protein
MSKHLFALTLPALVTACAGAAPPELAAAVDELSAAPCRVEKLTTWSTAGDEGRLVFSPDGRWAMFHREGPAGLELAESRRLPGGGWTPPTRPAFASDFLEFDPFIALDGSTVYYTSFRPTTPDGAGRPDGDLWRVRRTATGWTTPEHLGPTVNTDANEFFPSVTADGTLYWNSDRQDGVGAWDLWRAPRTGAGFGAAAPLPGDLNTAIWEFNPTLTPGGRLLALGSLDPDPAAPYSDVFFSLRIGGAYSAAVDAGPCVNTELEEYHPTIDWARNRLIFVRRNPDTSGDFYAVPLTAALRALAE